MKKIIFASLLSLFFISNLFAQKKDSVNYFRNTVAVNPLSIISTVSQAFSKGAGGSQQGLMYKRNYNNNRNAVRIGVMCGFSSFLNTMSYSGEVTIGHEWRKHSFKKFEHYYGADLHMGSAEVFRNNKEFLSYTSFSFLPFVGLRYNLVPQISFGYELSSALFNYSFHTQKEIQVFAGSFGNLQNSFALMYHL